MEVFDLVLFTFLFSIFGLLFFLMGLYFYKTFKNAKELYQTLAEKKNGRVGFSGITYPVLFIPLFQYEYKVYASGGVGENASSYTCFIGPFETSRDISLSITPKGILSGFGKMFGGQDIKINMPEFDQAFLIKAKDETFARNFLSSDILQVLLCFSLPTLRIEKNKIHLSIPFKIDNEDILEKWIDLGILIAKRMAELG